MSDANATAAPTSNLAPTDTTTAGAAEQSPAAGSSAREQEIELVINGKAEKWTMSKAKERLQRELAADQRFYEAKRLRDEAEGLTKKYKENPWEAFEGVDAKRRREMLEERLWQEMQAEQMSPEQRRVRELEEQIRKRDEDDAKRKKESEAAELEAAKASAIQEYASTFGKALESAGIKPGTAAAARAVARMAAFERANTENGQPVATVEQLAALVREEYSGEAKDWYSSLQGDSLLDELGESVVLNVVRAYAARVRAKQTAGAAKPAAQSVSVTTRPSEQPRNQNGQFTKNGDGKLSHKEWALSYTERKARGLL